MKKRNLYMGLTGALFLVCGLVFTLSGSGIAEEKPLLLEQTYVIEGMTCAACPITVKKAMSRVDGVESVSVNFKEKTATVLFDPDTTTSDVIAKASTAVGFPATTIKQDQHE